MYSFLFNICMFLSVPVMYSQNDYQVFTILSPCPPNVQKPVQGLAENDLSFGKTV